MVDTLVHENIRYGSIVDTLVQENKQLKETTSALLEKLNNLHMTSDTTFLATLQEYSNPISDDEYILWDTAPINPGGHFNTVFGAYIAPVHGYYL